MSTDVIATVLTGAGVVIGVWRLLAAYETRNDAAHAALSKRIDDARAELGGRIGRCRQSKQSTVVRICLPGAAPC